MMNAIFRNSKLVKFLSISLLICLGYLAIKLQSVYQRLPALSESLPVSGSIFDERGAVVAGLIIFLLALFFASLKVSPGNDEWRAKWGISFFCVVLNLAWALGHWESFKTIALTWPYAGLILVLVAWILFLGADFPWKDRSTRKVAQIVAFLAVIFFLSVIFGWNFDSFTNWRRSESSSATSPKILLENNLGVVIELGPNVETETMDRVKKRTFHLQKGSYYLVYLSPTGEEREILVNSPNEEIEVHFSYAAWPQLKMRGGPDGARLFVER